MAFYVRDKSKTYIQEQADKKKEQLTKAALKHYTKLDFIKMVGQLAQIIVDKDKKTLTLQDYRQVARDVYKIDTSIKARSLKRMMSTDIAKNMLNQELVRLYANAGLTKDSISTLIKEANEYATDKKDGNLKLKIVEKLEKAHDLTASQASGASKQYNTQVNFNEFLNKPNSEDAKISQKETIDDNDLSPNENITGETLTKSVLKRVESSKEGSNNG